MQERNQSKVVSKEPLTQKESHQVLRSMGGFNAALLEFRIKSIEELKIDPVIDLLREKDPEKRQGLVDIISTHFGWL